MFNFLANYLIDNVEGLAFWLTVSFAVAFIIAGIILFFAKKDYIKSYIKYAVLTFFVFALVLGIFLLVSDLIKHYNAAYLDKNYVSKDIIGLVLIPELITLFLALFATATGFILAKKKPAAVKKFGIILGIVCGIALIVSLVLIAVYYSRNIADNSYWSGDYGELNSTALYVSAIALVVISLAAAFISGRKDKSGFDSRCIAFAGISIALSFTLSYIKLWRMPQGGSVTLVSVLPIMLFSFVYGAKKGVLIGLIYGVLQSVQDPYIVHPAQFLLDYPIAYALTGLAGLLTYVKPLNKVPQLKFALSAIIGASLRFFSHVLSGVFAFGAYAKDAEAVSVWTYSLAYNSVVFVDIALVIVVGIILFSSKSFNRQVEKFNPQISLSE